MEGPEDLCPGPFGAAGVAAIIILRRLIPSSFFSLGVFLFRVFFCTAWRPRCARFSLLPVLHRDGCTEEDARVHVHPIFTSPFFGKLKASMPCDTPLWRLMVSCLSSGWARSKKKKICCGTCRTKKVATYCDPAVTAWSRLAKKLLNEAKKHLPVLRVNDCVALCLD